MDHRQFITYNSSPLLDLHFDSVLGSVGMAMSEIVLTPSSRILIDSDMLWSTTSNPFHQQEVVAALRGQPFCPEAVAMCCEWLPHRRARMAERLKRHGGPLVTLECTDGSVAYDRGMLVRCYHFIEDYLEECTRLQCPTTQVPLPYPLSVVRATMAVDGAPLLTCYSCLCHLNPKSNVYPFYFSMKGVSSSMLQGLINLMTPEEQDGVNAYYTKYAVHPVPERALRTVFRQLHDYPSLHMTQQQPIESSHAVGCWSMLCSVLRRVVRFFS